MSKDDTTGLLPKAKIVFEFLEAPDGSWYSKVTPITLPATSVRDMYKVAMLVAALQKHAQDSLGFIDAFLQEQTLARTEAEIEVDIRKEIQRGDAVDDSEHPDKQ